MAAFASAMEKRIRFHEMLERGVSPDDLVQMRLERHRQLIDRKIEQIAQALLGRQEEAARIIDGLIRELDLVDPFEAAQAQNEFLKRAMEKLQAVQDNLLGKVEPVEGELKGQTAIKSELQETLRTLRKTLEQKETQGNQVQNFLYGGGARISQYTSSHTGVS